jgi:hypothetical protein
MELDFALFADSAAVPPDGKVYILGGGFSTITLPQLPGRVTFAVVAGFRFGAADAGRTHQVELRFVDDGDKLVLPPVNLQFQSAGEPPPEGREITVSTVSFLSPMFGAPGGYHAEYWYGDRMLARVRMRVEEQQQAQPQVPPGAMGPRPN